MPECEETSLAATITDIGDNNNNNNNNNSRKTSETEKWIKSPSSPLALRSSSSTVQRDLWTNKAEFLLSVIGYVVDLGTN